MEAPDQKSAKVPKLTPSSSSSSCFITNLPTPMLMEILCRLPIKTLASCQLVCKSWLHLSRDPDFTQLHQAKAPAEVCFQLYHGGNTTRLHMGNFNSLSNYDPLDVKLNTLFELPKFGVSRSNALNYKTVTVDFKFSNSCNGLLCYNSGFFSKFVVVWNPCTSEYITLPAPPVSKTDGFRYGLGYSRKVNKYKLLRVVSKWIGSRCCFDDVGEILTIEQGSSWKSLGTCHSDYFCSSSEKYPSQATFLHGALHWASNKYSSEIGILTFDFEEDQFGRVPFPPSFGEKMVGRGPCRVGELLGCLFITEYTDEGMDIWLMKEYGIKDSWTKMYSLPCLVKGERQNQNQNRFLPLACLEDGEILLAHNKYISTGYDRAHYKYISTSVLSYDPDQEGLRFIGSGREFRAIVYKPSLVPLKDTMLGYKVHVSALRHREMSTSPEWWTLGAEEESATSESSESATYESSESEEAMPALQHGTEGGESHGHNGAAMTEDAMEQIKIMREELMEQQRKELCAQKQEFEERLRNEIVKAVEPFKEEIEQLKEDKRELEVKVKQLEEKLQQSKQL